MSNKAKTTRKTLQGTVTVTAIALISGCSFMPTYERPNAPVATQWPSNAMVSAADSTAGAASSTTVNWQDYFSDASLRQLIEAALANNRDLRVALLNIEQARAQLNPARS